jgi:hypothetical protein
MERPNAAMLNQAMTSGPRRHLTAATPALAGSFTHPNLVVRRPKHSCPLLGVREGSLNVRKGAHRCQQLAGTPMTATDPIPVVEVRLRTPDSGRRSSR